MGIVALLSSYQQLPTLQPVVYVAMNPRTLSAVAVGGATGALTRWALLSALTSSGEWPWAIFLTNIIGCSVLGLLVGRFQRVLHTSVMIGATAGFCGALTTFSGFVIDLAWFVHEDRWGLLITYLLISVTTGIAGFLTGRIAGIKLMPSDTSP